MTDLSRRCPNLTHETVWWRLGYETVVGVDEVGRGALAGPLIACAVSLPSNARRVRARLRGLDDSKQLTVPERERLFSCILDVALDVAIGCCEVDLIDQHGVGVANRIAMEAAVFNLSRVPDVLLIDAFTLDLDIPQVGLIDGDAISMSIAAASVVAKVTRDTRMRELGLSLPAFGFAEHKGYGTRVHLEALRLHGPCEQHRRSFRPVGDCLAVTDVRS